MLSHADLPGSTSDTRTHSSNSPFSIARTYRRIAAHLSRRIVVKGLLGLTLPAAVLTTSLPLAQPTSGALATPAAAFAVASTAGAFVGNAPLPDAALAAIAAEDELSGTLDFGSPIVRDYVVKVSADVANLRSGPGTSYAKIGKLPAGTALTVIERSGEWFRVRTPAGYVGWAAQEVLAIGSNVAASVTPAAAAPASASTATTNEASVNLRDGPSTRHAVIGKLPKGAALSVVARDGGWYKVTTNAGKTGWILGTFVNGGGSAPAAQAAASAPAAAAPSKAASTAANRVNVRQGPGTAYGSYGKLAMGSPVTLVARHGDWIQVRTARGTLGWILRDLVKTSNAAFQALPVTNDIPRAPAAAAAAPAQQSVAGSSRGALAARVALGMVGARYVWGGSSPRGFDCSGLVMYAYRQAGLRLPHNAAAQFSTRYGTRINSIGALKTGDMVFFANTAGRGITHVALYVGGGRMVTANSPRTGVQYSSINTNYWRSHFAGAIRPY